MSASLHIDGGLANDLPIDPFGSMPNWASRISGLGGDALSPDPSYVFRTVPVRPSLGLVIFTVHFFGLTGTHGTLRIEARAVSAFPGAEPNALEVLDVPVTDLVASNGTVEVAITSRRNTLYELSGAIEDESDVACSSIAITADRKLAPGEHVRGWRHPVQLSPRPAARNADLFIRSWLTRLDPPNFDSPVSQGWTSSQSANPHCASLVEELGLGDAAPHDAWREAFVLRALETYSAWAPGTSGLGFVAEPGRIAPVLAARGANLLLVEHLEGGQVAADPGLALERHVRPELCEEELFYDHALLTTCNWWYMSSGLADQFDFLWSVNGNRILDSGQYLHFVLASISCLKPGGLAVHVFDFGEADYEAPSDHVVFRPQVERIVTHALSHLNEVALLRFRQPAKSRHAKLRPFGLVIRRGRPK